MLTLIRCYCAIPITPPSVDRTTYKIQIPLPPKIDASVTMMQVEERPDVTYADVGGCKEQIEKLREVVETPLLDVSSGSPRHVHHTQRISIQGVDTDTSFL